MCVMCAGVNLCAPHVRQEGVGLHTHMCGSVKACVQQPGGRGGWVGFRERMREPEHPGHDAQCLDSIGGKKEREKEKLNVLS